MFRQRLGTFESLNVLVGIDSNIDYFGVDCEFVYFVDYKVDLDSVGCCFDNNRGNFDGLDNVPLVRYNHYGCNYYTFAYTMVGNLRAAINNKFY